MYKVWSINLCANTDGQTLVNALVQPPTEGSESYPLWQSQMDSFHASFKKRSNILVSALREMEGVTCNDVEGAMYVFPQITLGPKAEAAAADIGKPADFLYC